MSGFRWGMRILRQAWIDVISGCFKSILGRIGAGFEGFVLWVSGEVRGVYLGLRPRLGQVQYELGHLCHGPAEGCEERR
jgi:hypothetical protein